MDDYKRWAVRRALAYRFVAVAVFLIPATSAIKEVLRLNLPWIDPTLLIAPLAFLLLMPSLTPRSSLWVLGAAVVSSICGATILSADDSYVVVREVVRLALNFVWFWVVAEVVRRRPRTLVNALAVTVVMQLVIAMAINIVLAYLGQSDVLGGLVEYYGGRQTLWLGDFAFQRFMGTFFEGPPFGLFMLCALIVFLVAREYLGCNGRLATVGLCASIIGVVGAFTDQIFLGCFVLLSGLIVRRIGIARRGRLREALRIVVWLSIAAVASLSIARKADQIVSPTAATVIVGSSGGERMYHVEHATEAWAGEARSILFGIGPGRYGEVVAHSGPFAPTTTIQVTFVEWLAEYGLIGAMMLVLWLRSILQSAKRLGWLGSASLFALLAGVAFQANWKAEAWFMALALLYSAPERFVRLPHTRMAGIVDAAQLGAEPR